MILNAAAARKTRRLLLLRPGDAWIFDEPCHISGRDAQAVTRAMRAMIEGGRVEKDKHGKVAPMSSEDLRDLVDFRMIAVKDVDIDEPRSGLRSHARLVLVSDLLETMFGDECDIDDKLGVFRGRSGWEADIGWAHPLGDEL